MQRAHRAVLVTDLDHTLYDPDDTDNRKLLRFNAIWNEHCRDDCLLVYSTGRSRQRFEELRVRYGAGLMRCLCDGVRQCRSRIAPRPESRAAARA